MTKMRANNAQTSEIKEELKKTIRKAGYYLVALGGALALPLITWLWVPILILIVLSYLLLDWIFGGISTLLLRDLIVATLVIYFYQGFKHATKVIKQMEQEESDKMVEKEAKGIFGVK